MKKSIVWALCAIIVSSVVVWAAQVSILQTDTRQEAWTKETANNSDLQANINLKQDILSEGAFVDGDKTDLDLNTTHRGLTNNPHVVTENANHSGDVTGATALTLATVNSNVGSFTNADVTVNSKGLVTAVSNGSSGSGDLKADGTVPLTADWDAGVFTITADQIIASGGVSTGNGTADGGAYYSLLEDTDNGTNYSGWGVFGDLATSTIYMFPLAAPTANQILQFAVPGNQTMSDGTTKSVSIGTWTSPGAETNSLETTITGIADEEIFIGDGADSGAFVVISGDMVMANTGEITLDTVNSNVGQFTNSTVTVNAKGLITAIENGSGASVSAYETGTEADFYGTVINPQGVYDATTAHHVSFAVNIPAAFTVTAIYISCDADPTTEPTLTFQHKAAGVGYGSPTTIEAVTTTAGVASITSGIDDATIPANTKLFFTLSDPDDTLEEITWQIKGAWD